MTRIIFLTLCIFVAGCSNTPFNEKYANAGWNKIIIAPFDGSLAETAELTFDHKLATTPNINVIPTSMVKMFLKEESLIDTYAQAPQEALFTLAERINANGILFADVKSIVPVKRSSADLASNSVEIYVKLIDAKTKRTVASNHHESTSLFSSATTLVKNIAEDSADEMIDVFSWLSTENR